MAYTLYNNNKIATVGGVVTSGTTYTSYDVVGGSMKAGGATSSVLNPNDLDIRVANVAAGNNLSPTLVATKDVGLASYDTALSINTVTSGGTNNSFFELRTTGANRVAVGTIVTFTDTNSILVGPSRVTSLPSSSGFVVARNYAAGAGTVTYATGNGNATLGSQTASNYAMIGVDCTLHGIATSVMDKSADFGNREAIKKVDAVRTYKVATAIRNGQWNPFTGRFTTTPSSANDYSSMDVDGTDQPDDESKKLGVDYQIGGGFAFKKCGRPGANGVTRANYDVKTT